MLNHFQIESDGFQKHRGIKKKKLLKKLLSDFKNSRKSFGNNYFDHKDKVNTFIYFC